MIQEKLVTAKNEAIQAKLGSELDTLMQNIDKHQLMEDEEDASPGGV